MKLLYLSGHSTLESDECSLFTELGIECFALGSYVNPQAPADPKRPAIPEMKRHPELEACLRGNDRENLPQELIDWADTIMIAALPNLWLVPNWERIKHKRVIWRTIGQSNKFLEQQMKPYHDAGLKIVRYSPMEKLFFGESFAGEDALIRFYKDPLEFRGWNGERNEVGQISQHMVEPHGRDLFTNWKWLEQATEGLPLSFAGSNSEKIGGLGELSYEQMKLHLRGMRAYCYTATIPASYTLGLAEAMMTWIPVVSIGPSHMWSGPGLFEGHKIALWSYDDPAQANAKLRELLREPDWRASSRTRQAAINLFGKYNIKEQWRGFLL